MRRPLFALLLTFLPATIFAQPIEIQLRVVQEDTPTRTRDTNFQLAATSGFSVVQTLGNYYLFGSAGTYRSAWNSAGTHMWDLEFPSPNHPDWRPELLDDKKKCDPKKDPRVRDVRCGDASGVVWKQPSSPSLNWNYFNHDLGAPDRIPPFPAVGSWPRQWPAQYHLTGIPGYRTTIDAAKINAAIPVRTPPTSTPASCTRDDWNPDFLSTGAADTKVVYVNGKWYMGFNETINNPTPQGGWTAGDLFNVGWATSTDGRNWSIKRILFRTTRETMDCGNGLLLTQLFTDGGFFYMVVQEIAGRGVLLLRAPIDTSNPDGYTSWQIATHHPSDPNRYQWVATPAGGMLDTTALNAYGIMPTVAFVKQAAIARIFNSTAPSSPSRIIGITVQDLGGGNNTLQLWSAPDLDTPFTFQSTVDTAFIKPFAIFGWEFAFTYYPDHSPATPRIAGREFDFWLNGNFYTGGNLDGFTKHFTGYRATATLSGGIFAPRAALRTQANYFVSAPNETTVNAVPTAVGLNERWILIDANGGSLVSGDVVHLLARNGLYLSNGGASTLTASKAAPAVNESFFIEKKNPGGTAIVNGDQIAFRAQSTGKYIIAAQGGGSTVHNNGLDANPNTRFTYVVN